MPVGLTILHLTFWELKLGHVGYLLSLCNASGADRSNWHVSVFPSVFRAACIYLYKPPGLQEYSHSRTAAV